MKGYIAYIFNLILSFTAILGGVYIIRNFIGKMSVLNFTGWVLCFAGAMAILSEVLRFMREKRTEKYEG